MLFWSLLLLLLRLKILRLLSFSPPIEETFSKAIAAMFGEINTRALIVGVACGFCGAGYWFFSLSSLSYRHLNWSAILPPINQHFPLSTIRRKQPGFTTICQIGVTRGEVRPPRFGRGHFSLAVSGDIIAWLSHPVDFIFSPCYRLNHKQ